MSLPPGIEPRFNATRDEFLWVLSDLGPRYTTRVIVNGRPALLDAVIAMVERLPDSVRCGHHGQYVFIDPDPFAREAESASRPDPASSAESADLVKRLIARQAETDRLAAKAAAVEQRERTWWSRLKGRLPGRS